MADGKMQIAVFGGGCFWCTEAVFKELKGVISVVPGYSGGNIQNPTYEDVSTGKTGHAEVIKIEYDPDKISYEDLLTVFFATHDPTALNQQGVDVGAQYRSVIFYTADDQKNTVDIFIKKLRKSGLQAVTEVQPLEAFYEAEEYHKDYYFKNVSAPYCRLNIDPKIERLRAQFKELLLPAELRRVAREKGTEAPFSGKYWQSHESGMYRCAICGAELFSSDAKFDSGTGWPSFTKPANLKNIELHEDRSEGMIRTEVRCKKCGAHLGHVFDDLPRFLSKTDGPKEKDGKRYCINSVCLDLETK